MKVKVDIFSGFLGAGKTRLIKKLIEDNYYNETIAIIENEFGEVSIDGEILRNTKTVVKEITAGCICCQVTGDFKKSILEVIESYNVERLIIEPTGVAKLSDIKKTFKEEELRDKLEVDRLITVVDSERYYMYIKNFRNFFVDQIKSADVVVLSRVQLAAKDDIDKINIDLKGINKNALIVSEDWTNINGNKLIPKSSKVFENNNGSSPLIRSLKKAKVNEIREVASADIFQTFAINISRKISKDELISKFNFISKNNGFGQIIRAKGIVGLQDGSCGQFDFTVDEFNIEKVNYTGNPVISFIGTNLNKNEITKFFL